VDEHYLALGLSGVAAAGEPFMAHFGAALLAAWWFDHDQGLPDETSDAMARQADALVAKHSWLFAEQPTGPPTDRGDEVVDALASGLDHTWAIGHDVIFAALVARTWQQRPELVTDRTIAGILAVLLECRGQPLETFGGVFDVCSADAGDVEEAEVETSERLAQLALRTVMDFDHVYLGLHQGDIGHIADHAHALLVLDRLGYHEIARRGSVGFREHIAAARLVSSRTADLPEVAARRSTNPQHPAYWAEASPSNDWAVGHVFKYPYALLDLISVAGAGAITAPILGKLAQLVAPSA
jgi:hypothetical protein